MVVSRRTRLIWQGLLFIPLLGLTTDVLASEVARRAHVTVDVPWLFSLIGVEVLLLVAIIRACYVPLVPENLDGPDDLLTRRARVLGARLKAAPVRVFVCDFPDLIVKMNTYCDGDDLYVSRLIEELPEAERDFALAQSLVMRGPAKTLLSTFRLMLLAMGVTLVLGSGVLLPIYALKAAEPVVMAFSAPALLINLLMIVYMIRCGKDFNQAGAPYVDRHATLATGDVEAAIRSRKVLTRFRANWLLNRYESEMRYWWDNSGKQVLEAEDWYQKQKAQSGITASQAQATSPEPQLRTVS